MLAWLVAQALCAGEQYFCLDPTTPVEGITCTLYEEASFTTALQTANANVFFIANTDPSSPITITIAEVGTDVSLTFQIENIVTQKINLDFSNPVSFLNLNWPSSLLSFQEGKVTVTSEFTIPDSLFLSADITFPVITFGATATLVINKIQPIDTVLNSVLISYNIPKVMVNYILMTEEEDKHSIKITEIASQPTSYTIDNLKFQLTSTEVTFQLNDEQIHNYELDTNFANEMIFNVPRSVYFQVSNDAVGLNIKFVNTENFFKVYYFGETVPKYQGVTTFYRYVNCYIDNFTQMNEDNYLVCALELQFEGNLAFLNQTTIELLDQVVDQNSPLLYIFGDQAHLDPKDLISNIKLSFTHAEPMLNFTAKSETDVIYNLISPGTLGITTSATENTLISLNPPDSIQIALDKIGLFSFTKPIPGTVHLTNIENLQAFTVNSDGFSFGDTKIQTLSLRIELPTNPQNLVISAQNVPMYNYPKVIIQTNYQTVTVTLDQSWANVMTSGAVVIFENPTNTNLVTSNVGVVTNINSYFASVTDTTENVAICLGFTEPIFGCSESTLEQQLLLPNSIVLVVNSTEEDVVVDITETNIKAQALMIKLDSENGHTVTINQVGGEINDFYLDSPLIMITALTVSHSLITSPTALLDNNNAVRPNTLENIQFSGTAFLAIEITSVGQNVALQLVWSSKPPSTLQFNFVFMQVYNLIHSVSIAAGEFTADSWEIKAAGITKVVVLDVVSSGSFFVSNSAADVDFELEMTNLNQMIQVSPGITKLQIGTSLDPVPVQYFTSEEPEEITATTTIYFQRVMNCLCSREHFDCIPQCKQAQELPENTGIAVLYLESLRSEFLSFVLDPTTPKLFVLGDIAFPTPIVYQAMQQLSKNVLDLEFVDLHKLSISSSTDPGLTLAIPSVNFSLVGPIFENLALDISKCLPYSITLGNISLLNCVDIKIPYNVNDVEIQKVILANMKTIFQSGQVNHSTVVNNNFILSTSKQVRVSYEKQNDASADLTADEALPTFISSFQGEQDVKVNIVFDSSWKQLNLSKGELAPIKIDLSGCKSDSLVRAPMNGIVEIVGNDQVVVDTSDHSEKDDDGNGLPTYGIVLIVIACVIIAAIIVLFALKFAGVLHCSHKDDEQLPI